MTNIRQLIQQLCPFPIIHPSHTQTRDPKFIELEQGMSLCCLFKKPQQESRVTDFAVWLPLYGTSRQLDLLWWASLLFHACTHGYNRPSTWSCLFPFVPKGTNATKQLKRLLTINLFVCCYSDYLCWWVLYNRPYTVSCFFPWVPKETRSTNSTKQLKR